MALSLVTAATSDPVTVAEAKAHCRIDHNDEDTLIQGFIKAATSYAETFTRRQFVTATWRLSLDAFPCWEIVLPLPPVQSITSITYVDGDGSTQTLDPSNYSLDSYSQPARITPAYGQFWPATRLQSNAVNVTFVAGYSTVPETIKTAIKLLVAHWFEHREAVAEGSMTAVPMAVESLLMSEQWGSYA